MRVSTWSARSAVIAFFACLLVLGGASGSDAAVGTAFTYQGRLDANGAPVNGHFDFELRLYNAPAGGTQVGPTVTVADVVIVDGLVTLRLDFGPVFTGNALWLEIGLRPVGGGSFELLSPRQEVTPGPNAQWS